MYWGDHNDDQPRQLFRHGRRHRRRGLGDLAIRFGYQRFRGDVMLYTVVVLVVLVQVIQMLGNFIARRVDHRHPQS